MEHNRDFMSHDGDGVSTISYGNGILEFDVAKVFVEADVDTKYQGNFNFRVSADREISGYIYASGLRMQTTDQKFFGKNLNVPFMFDTTGMEQGDTAAGEFYLVTNIGEFSLPYEVCIKGKTLQGELGEIRNLFHFANLSRVNWKQAKECFVNPLFFQVLVGSGRQYTERYKMLLQYGYETGNMDLAMDRFLILIHKKQAVSYECLQHEYVFSRENLPDKIKIEMQRIGWGYTYAKIESQNGFCKTDVVLTDDDFEQDRASFFVNIDKSRLHVGENRASLQIAGSNAVLCEIVIHIEKNETNVNSEKWKQDILKSGIMRLYLDYRTGRRPIKESFKMAEKLLAQFREIDALLPALYEAHLKLLRNKDNEAIWLLKNIKRMVKEQDVPLEVYGYFLYLLAMSGDDSQKKASDLLEQYATNHSDVFFLYWGYMHKDHLQYENPAVAYRRLRLYFENGCTSPVLYMEAAMMILENELLLSSITDFEIQIFLFMERYALLSNSLCEQMYKLPFSVKTLCPQFINLCKKHPSKDENAMAKMMCRLYMKIGYMGPDAAEWFKKGIQADCRINGLYEAYIRSLDMSIHETLPSEVVRYFAFDTPLEERYLAYVYEKILKQQENLSADYLNRIHDFTVKQLLKGKMNHSLSYLYLNVLSVEDMDEKLQLQLQKLAFANEIVLDRSLQYKSCMVRQRGLKGQMRYTIKRSRAVIYLYTNEYTMMFEDADGNIVDCEDGYQIRPFMDYQKTKRLLRGCNNLSIGEQIYLHEKRPLSSVNKIEEFDITYKQYLWLLQQDVLEDDLKQELSKELMQSLQKWDMHKDSQKVLIQMDVEDFAPKDRAEFVSALVYIGQYEKAYEIICTHGMEGIRLRTLLGVCQYMLTQDDTMYQEKLLKLAYEVFCANKYTDEILQYLNLYFMGTFKQMKEIYQALLTMDLPASEIAQRVLENIIFTESYPSEAVDIFRYSYENGVREELIDIYLAVRADAYLVYGDSMEDDLWELLNNRMQNGVKISPGAQLAWLKYHSERIDSLTNEERRMCIDLLAESLKEDLYFSFFNAYVFLYPVLEIYGEQTYVEYCAKKNQKIQIHYMEGLPGQEEKRYCTEEMNEIYPGIYQKAFRIFWGEKILYYITEMVDGEEQFREKGDLEMLALNKENRNGRYHFVNEIAMAMELMDYPAIDILTEKYELHKYLVKNILKMK